MKFQGVLVTAAEFAEQPTTEIPGFASWAEVSVPKGQKQIDLKVTTESVEGIRPFAIFQSRPQREAVFTLSVPVRWTNQGPLTRQRGVDNVDIILLDLASRHFKDIQVGVVVRGGRFYLTAQRIWEGWIVGDTSSEEPQFVPSAPEHAYPGADYASIWRGMADVMEFTWSLLEEYGKGPTDVATASWAPSSSTPEQGWKTGTVLYFNMITGTGMILDQEERRFVHFSTIWDDGRMKVLRPMTSVQVQVGLDGKVIACKPAA